MNKEYHEFLLDVKKRSNSSDTLRDIIFYATEGLQEELTKQRSFAADMEVVAASALDARLYKGNKAFIVHLLKKWIGYTSLNWDNQVVKLEAKDDNR